MPLPALPASISDTRAAPLKPQSTHIGSGASGCADEMSGQTVSSSAICSAENLTDATLLRCKGDSQEECEEQINQRMILKAMLSLLRCQAESFSLTWL